MDAQATPSETASPIVVDGGSDRPSDSLDELPALTVMEGSPTTRIREQGSEADDSPDTGDIQAHGSGMVLSDDIPKKNNANVDDDEHDESPDLAALGPQEGLETSACPTTGATAASASVVPDELDTSASDNLVQEFLNAKASERIIRDRSRNNSNDEPRDNKNNRNNSQSHSRRNNDDDSLDDDSYYSSSSSDSEDISTTFESIRREYECNKGNPSKNKKQHQTPEGAPAPLIGPEDWIDDHDYPNDHHSSADMSMNSSSNRIPRKSGITTKGPGLASPGRGRGHENSGRGRGGPGRSTRRMLPAKGLMRAFSGGNLVKSHSGTNLLGGSSSGNGLGRGSPARAGRGREGRGPPAGRGRGSGMAFSNSFESGPGLLDENSREKAIRPTFKRAATERFRNRPEEDDEDDPMAIPKVRRKGRSMSMDFGGRKAASLKPEFNRTVSNNRFSVAFGASREQGFYQPKIIRKSRKIDIQTGGETQREIICQRIIDYPLAMNPADRRRKMAFRTAKENNNRISMHGDYFEPQFRLHSKIQASGVRSQFKGQIETQSLTSQTVHPGALTTYLIWSLRSPFFVVLLSEALAFWLLTTIFAVCIYLGATYQPDCLRFLPDNLNFEEAGGYYLDAFTLSWTTFSTVGYGLIYPQIRKEPEETSFHCAFMTTIVSLESFLGVLFASFCGAVIVGKMTRAKSTASIRYSQRMVLRFGIGVTNTNDDDDRCGDADDEPVSDYDRSRTLYPCPVLEFRVANSLFANDNGEITNAKIHVVGSTLANKDKRKDSGYRKSKSGTESSKHSSRQKVLAEMKNSASQFIRKHRPILPSSASSWSNTSASAATEKKSKKGNGTRKREKSVLLRVSAFSQVALENVMVKKKMLRPKESLDDATIRRKPVTRTTTKEKKPICVEEDPSGGLAPRKMFSNIKTESEVHPFFKRVWTIRHVLNADSPLLSEKASRMIKESRGHWPSEACNAKFIRENVQFQQLIVSMSGTTGASKVFGLNVYEYRNLHIGYKFASILLTAMDGRMEVDVDGIDTVREQRGGGAEAIDIFKANQHGHNFFTGQSSEFNMSSSNKEAGLPLDESSNVGNSRTSNPHDSFNKSMDSIMDSMEDLSIAEGESGDECSSADDTTDKVEDNSTTSDSAVFRRKINEIRGSKILVDFPNVKPKELG